MSMDKNIQKDLAGFEQVWRRVIDKKAQPSLNQSSGVLPALMPRKSQKPKRRFDPK